MDFLPARVIGWRRKQDFESLAGGSWRKNAAASTSAGGRKAVWQVRNGTHKSARAALRAKSGNAGSARMAMNRVHRSILLSAIERYGSLLFFLVSTAILSRLLSPHEFGIYAVVNALILVLASAFQEFGGANYLVQKRDLSRLNIRTAFTLTFLFSIVTGTILFMLRDAIASIFAEDGLRLGVAVSVVNFLVWPFSATLSALLRRDLDFSTLTASNLAGNFVMAAASIVLAVLDYSFMAPIWGALAGNMVTAAVLLASRKDAGLFRPSLAGYPDVLRFGAYSSGVVIINVFYNFSPQFFLARMLDFAAAGLYSRAVTITQTFDRLVVQVLNSVIMPAISPRNGPAKA